MPAAILQKVPRSQRGSPEEPRHCGLGQTHQTIFTRWEQAANNAPHGGIIYSSGWTNWGDLLRPHGHKEKNSVMNKSKYSRPGPSFWKVAFLRMFPVRAQDAYGNLIDTQRACGIIASCNKKDTQVNLGKSTGGVRPLTMLEE